MLTTSIVQGGGDAGVKTNTVGLPLSQKQTGRRQSRNQHCPAPAGATQVNSDLPGGGRVDGAVTGGGAAEGAERMTRTSKRRRPARHAEIPAGRQPAEQPTKYSSRQAEVWPVETAGGSGPTTMAASPPRTQT